MRPLRAQPLDVAQMHWVLHRPLPVDAGPSTANELFYFLEGCHGRVAWRCHCERTMRGAILDCLLCRFAAQKAINQARGKAVTPTDAVVDPKISVGRLVELAIVPHQCSPTIDAECASRMVVAMTLKFG